MRINKEYYKIKTYDDFNMVELLEVLSDISFNSNSFYIIMEHDEEGKRYNLIQDESTKEEHLMRYYDSDEDMLNDMNVIDGKSMFDLVNQAGDTFGMS